MNRLIMVAVVASAFAGCRSLKVENYGQTVACTDDGKVLVVDGKPVVLSKGWMVKNWQHWMITKADKIATTIKPEEIGFEMNGLDSSPDSEGLAKVLKDGFAGAAELSTKICAGIATCGGTACADTIGSLVGKFIMSGGNVSKAKVECKDGACTITDGTTTCSDFCYDCVVK